jgi:hypothetical protein
MTCNKKGRSSRNGHAGGCKQNPNYALSCERKRQAKLGIKHSKEHNSFISIGMAKYWDLIREHGDHLRDRYLKIHGADGTEQVDIFFGEDF